ncbi:MAG TPA: response regulator [Candidatus Nesterenkonia stercoripullorum]|uniref:Response regulator n=1 Tax=Candidatus Nesterenkonia stercoripullorum TaxID=2838701 RepID=A0A9D2A7X0_9MICC|nr:response regulator [Candidatus Nesterenkonia stercoripullorum]
MDATVPVLIIEDDDDIRRLLELALPRTTMTISSVGTGSEGVEACRAEDPALVTVDIGLPDIDGIEVVQQLREFYHGTIVVISARSAERDRATAMAAGADAFLTKPFRPRELRSAITELLESSGHRSDVPGADLLDGQ